MARSIEKQFKKHLKGLRVKKIFLAFASLPTIVLAATGSGDYDIVPRTVNFLIFAAILFYLLANPAKNFYKGRIAKIASRLEDIQKRVLESKNKKLEMMKKIEDAKKEAISAVTVAKKEAELLSQKIKDDTKNDILMLEKNFEEQKKYEKRKMQKELVAKVLGQVFDSKESQLKQDEILNIMLKKVS